jgi:predicted kinase
VPGQLVLLCGTSFSGKSTIARTLSDGLPGVTVSLDMINEERGLRGGQGVPIEEWVQTHEIARDRVGTALAANDTVIVDDTSSPRFLREAWRTLAGDHHAPFALVFVDAALGTVLARLAANRRSLLRHDVTDDVLSAHLAAFEPPDADETHVHVVAEDVSPQVVTRVRSALAAAVFP